MNVFESVAQIQAGEEYFDTLMEHPLLKIVRIFSNSVQDGQWYDQDHDEWVVLLEGEAVLAFEDQIQALVKGDYVLIEAHQKHRVKSTSADALWLAIYLKKATL